MTIAILRLKFRLLIEILIIYLVMYPEQKYLPFWGLRSKIQNVLKCIFNELEQPLDPIKVFGVK